MAIVETRPRPTGWLERYDAAVAGVLPTLLRRRRRPAPRAAWVTDVDGRRYLDLGSGIAVTNVGHRHPHVVAAIARAGRRAAPHVGRRSATAATSSSPRRSARLVPWIDRAAGVPRATAGPRRSTAPSSWPASRHRPAGHRRLPPGLPRPHAGGHVAHDREGEVPRRATTRSLPVGAHRARTAPCRRRPRRRSTSCSSTRRRPTTIAAMIVEPVLGEGGYVVPPVAWLAGLRERCDQHGILLVFDEVQTGFGRTGRPFAAETFGVFPDVAAVRQGRRLRPAARRHRRRRRALMDRWPERRPRLDLRRQPGRVRRRARHHRGARATRASTTGPARSARSRIARLQRGRRRQPAVRRGARRRPDDRRRAGRRRRRRARCSSAASTRACSSSPAAPTARCCASIPPLTITDAELDHGLGILIDALAAG